MRQTRYFTQSEQSTAEVKVGHKKIPSFLPIDVDSELSLC